MSQTRWIVVDDRDSQISYIGNSWSPIDGGQYNSQGNFGYTYLNTLYSTTATGARMSFSFTGNAARIIGTNSPTIDASGKSDPDWDCILDGAVVTRDPTFKYTENNWSFCKFYDLPAGRHTIGVNVKSNGRPFLLDQIQYKPTARVDHATTMITRFDADLKCDSSWQLLGDVGRMATTTDATASFPFTGSRLSWWAMYPMELPHDAASGIYSIDGGDAVPFAIPGGGSQSDYNRKVFETPQLSRGLHTISVTYQGGGSQTPLVVSHLLVEDGTTELAPQSAPSTSGGSTDTGNTGSGSGNTGSGNTSKGSSGSSSSGASVPSGSATTSKTAGDSTPTHISDKDSESVPNVYDISLLNSTSTTKGGSNPTSGLSTDKSSVPETTNRGPAGFPVGAIVGIVLGVLLVVACLLAWFLWRRRRERHIQLSENPHNIRPFSPSGSQFPSGALSPDPSVSMREPYGGYVSERGTMSSAPHRYSSASHPYSASQAPSSTTDGSSTTHLLQPLRKGQGPADMATTSSPEALMENPPSNSRILVHEDSGVRIPRPPSELIEYPPIYTPG